MGWATEAADSGWTASEAKDSWGAASEEKPQEAVGKSAPQQQPELDEEDRKVVSGLIDALHDVEVKLADKQADVNSPLFSAKTFEELGLKEELLKGIYAMKFKKPSKVQERALPLLLSSPPTDMIAQSQSGTGKTAAFALTILSRIAPGDDEGYVQAVCLAPTRELARQIYAVIKEMGQYTKATISVALREEGAREGQIGDNILIGTPGTINDLERKRLVDLSRCRVFVLDEADVMLDKQGMGTQSLRVRKACPDTVQTVFFSATFTDEVVEFANRIAPNANRITLKRNELSVDAIKQFYMDCNGFPDKFRVLSAIYGLLTVSQSIIFVATRNTAQDVQAHMEADGHRTSLLHGGMAPEERDLVIDEFRAGKTKVLISTNVLARGIDILQVSLVVNFDLPMTVDRQPDPETYLHRIGRTGRFGRTGVAINFVHNRQSLECLLSFEKFFGRDIGRIPTESIDDIEAKLAGIS